MRRLLGTPAGARPRPGSSLSRLAAGAALAGALLLAGCALPSSGEPGGGRAEDELPYELGKPSAPLHDSDLLDLRRGPPPLAWWDEADDELADAERTRESKGDARPATRIAGSAPAASVSPSPSPAPAQVTTLAAVTDPRGDAGDGPGHADLRALTLSDSGRTAVVRVDLDAAIPKNLAEGEVMGIGVDLYYGAGPESDYQLFADGGSDGWRAYLHTPAGFVDYPGAFRLGKSRVVFEVPWSALGRPRSGSVSSFADWSRRARPMNDFSEDAAPDRGRRAFRR